MKAHQVLEITAYVDRSKIRQGDLFLFDKIERRANEGKDPDDKESVFIQSVYRYTSGGGERQDQPFKAYRRKTSWGVR